ncbi:hypothetical protein BDN67DRAFT_676210 [Paxillus ammoniavirescens]|nr:hypothetical protein BDN67DRAFT_676210 [Paxillus ammoniavirescens]
MFHASIAIAFTDFVGAVDSNNYNDTIQSPVRALTTWQCYRCSGASAIHDTIIVSVRIPEELRLEVIACQNPSGYRI